MKEWRVSSQRLIDELEWGEGWIRVNKEHFSEKMIKRITDKLKKRRKILIDKIIWNNA